MRGSYSYCTVICADSLVDDTCCSCSKPLVNSMFTVALIVGISVHETTLGTTVANLGFQEITFPKPLFHGDTVRVETEVVLDTDNHTARFRVMGSLSSVEEDISKRTNRLTESLGQLFREVETD